MEHQKAISEVERILSADLGALSQVEGIAVRPPAALGAWRIAVPDKESLAAYGLPLVSSGDMLMRVGASFQSTNEPEYAGDGWNGYLIGQCGGDVRIVVSDVSGSVFAVPEARELAPPLAHLRPDGIIPDELINSRAADFVDFCWRWYWLCPILVEQREDAGRAEMTAWEAARKSGGSFADVDYDFHAPYRDLCSRVRDNFYSRDRVAVSDPGSMWSSMIDGFE